MERVDQEYLQEIMKATGDSETTVSNNVKVLDDGTTIEEILVMAEKLGTGDDALDSNVILKFFKVSEMQKRDYSSRFCFTIIQSRHGWVIHSIENCKYHNLIVIILM